MALTHLVQLLEHSLLSVLRVQLSQLQRLIKFTDTRCSRWTPTFKFFCQTYKAIVSSTNLDGAKQQPTSPCLRISVANTRSPDLHATMARREPFPAQMVPYTFHLLMDHLLVIQRQQPVTSQLLVSNFSGRFTRCIFLRQMFSYGHLCNRNLAESIQIVSPVCRAASRSPSEAMSRCQRRRSNSAAVIPGDCSWSRQ